MVPLTVEATAVNRVKVEVAVEAVAETGNEVLPLPAGLLLTPETIRQQQVAVDNGLVARHRLPNLRKVRDKVVAAGEVEEDEAVALLSLMVPSRHWSSRRMGGDQSRIHPHWLSQRRKSRRF